MKFLNSMTFQVFHDLYEPCLNKINKRIHVKIACRIFGLSLNSKTTVNDANHTKRFIFKIIDSLMKNVGVWKPVSSIQSCFNTSCFDTNSSSEISQKLDHFEKSLQLNKKNILGEYFSFFKPSTWNYLHLDWTNSEIVLKQLVSKDFVSKLPVTTGVSLPRDVAEEKISRLF